MSRNVVFLSFLGALFLAGCSSASGSADQGAGGVSGQGGQSSGGTAMSPDAGDDAGGEDSAPVAVTFQDEHLEDCVREALGQPEGPLVPDELAQLDHLACQDMGITSVDGLEFATGLEDLTLWENEIKDIKPLGALTRLKSLQLGDNQVSNVEPLSKLTSLEHLGLEHNLLTDLSPLGKLSSLRWLNLDTNKFDGSQLVHLSGLTGLTWLTIEHNVLKDTSALKPLVDAGCDIYGLVETKTTSLGLDVDETVFPKDMNNPWRRLLEDGRVRATVSHGNVTLKFAAHGVSVPGLFLSPGRLVFDGGRIRYVSSDGRSVEVGDESTGSVCSGAYGSKCSLLVGRIGGRGQWQAEHQFSEPVVTVQIQLPGDEMRTMDGEVMSRFPSMDKAMVPLAMPSPNQMDAGSCLFMANTGAMEVLLNQHSVKDKWEPNGDTDLSERYLMNASDRDVLHQIPYQLTDVGYTYNIFGGALLNRDYPFCAGYVKEVNGNIQRAEADDDGAQLSCQYNWFDDLPDGWTKKLTPTPPMERTLLFVDPKRDKYSKWRVALLNEETIDKIKYEIRTKHQPVLVIYNHFLYWHTNVIVGYDDDADSQGCRMVEKSIEYYREKGADSYADAIEAKLKADGGCQDKGVFYVRDSIYEGGLGDPLYDYSWNGVTISKEKYSRRIIKLSYNWARYLGNHVYTVHR